MGIINAATMGAYGSSWQHKGYCGGGNVAGLLDSLEGRPVVVCGNARTVFDELEQAQAALGETALTFAVNDIGAYLPRVDHWLSLHDSKLTHWVELRRDGEGRWNKDTQVHSIRPGKNIDHVWAGLTPTFALSGYFAAQVAYLMGARPIVLAGCPGEPCARFFEAKPREVITYQNRGVLKQLEDEFGRNPEFKAAVRSMGGFTKRFFGGL